MGFSTKSLTLESWILYALGVFLVACRLISRRIKLGKWKHLQADDYLMLFALANFTGVVVSINEVARNGSNYMSPEQVAQLTPETTRMAIYGSIMTFVLEIFTLTGLWTVKACLLILYSRLTKGVLTTQHLIVRIATIYCIFSYVLVMVMFLFFWCHPTYEYWAVPVKIMQCATYYHHMIFATAFNISSDILLFFIPIPIIIKTKLSMRRKVILCCILGLGVFNILAAILNRYYNFSNPNSYVFLFWYVAEVGMSIFVGNLPLCWPLFRLAFRLKDVSQEDSSYKYRHASRSWRARPRPKDVLTTFGTTFGTTFDKTEEEYTVATEERRTASDGGARSSLCCRGTSPATSTARL
ncbi:hypothetical protein PT974_04137 [Cladobotryum mycophilum]|uniref:Rhodopsin domain-containing protein n=1 Tax=Cladobotryum mycophilum TaxID=491253 RepID=A0ABR0SVC6_9HYPO